MGIPIAPACVAVQRVVAFSVFSEDTPLQRTLLQLSFGAYGHRHVPVVRIHMTAGLVSGLAATQGCSGNSSVQAHILGIRKFCHRLAHIFVACRQHGHARFHHHQRVVGLLLGR